MKDSYYLQRIDCNCNDCAFMERDISKFELIAEWRKIQQFSEFERKKASLMAIPETRGKAEKMTFQYERGTVKYGHCTKFNKSASFIPVTCQIETQECLVHRLDK